MYLYTLTGIGSFSNGLYAIWREIISREESLPYPVVYIAGEFRQIYFAHAYGLGEINISIMHVEQLQTLNRCSDDRDREGMENLRGMLLYLLWKPLLV